MPFYDLNKVKSKTLAAGVEAFPAWGEGVMLVRVELAPNSQVPLHSHPHEQAGIVLGGEVEFTIGDEVKQMKEGDVYIIPSGVSHGGSTGDKSALILDVFNPPREDYKP